MAKPLTDPTAPVEVAGLEIPADLAPLIIEAFRDIYPTITDGKDDDSAVRHVLLWFITTTLETTANRKAQAALDSTISQLRTGADVQAQRRRDQIRAAAGRIKQKPTPPGLAE